MAMEYYEAVGRRKTATARVRLYPSGEGNVVVNDRPMREYFCRAVDVQRVQSPLQKTATESRFNISIKVTGGGMTGQADAAKLGIARALVEADPDFRTVLSRSGLLTRDAREKERKKPGLKRARKAPQYTKR